MLKMFHTPGSDCCPGWGGGVPKISYTTSIAFVQQRLRFEFLFLCGNWKGSSEEEQPSTFKCYVEMLATFVSCDPEGLKAESKTMTD